MGFWIGLVIGATTGGIVAFILGWRVGHDVTRVPEGWVSPGALERERKEAWDSGYIRAQEVTREKHRARGLKAAQTRKANAKPVYTPAEIRDGFGEEP